MELKSNPSKKGAQTASYGFTVVTHLTTPATPRQKLPSTSVKTSKQVISAMIK
jgi:hypothetical protein